MKKKIAALILLCAFMASINMGLALAAGYGTAIVDGKTADRVHLRKLPSETSDSLGLYFTGTEVNMQSDPGKEWVSVLIGSESGYMNSAYLYRGNGSIQPKQPWGVARASKSGGYINLREEPSLQGTVEKRVYDGDTVTVLGETDSKWYYVDADGQYGYMMADYLTVAGGETPVHTNYGTAIVNGRSSDRVHLRKGPSANSDSMGLYFTGTEVTLRSDPEKEWVSVLAGSEQGYMMSDYLYSGNNPGIIKSRQPSGIAGGVKAGSYINLRSEPSLMGGVAGRIYPGDKATVLGETAGKWYYVKAGSVKGYVTAEFLAVSGSDSPSYTGYIKAVVNGRTSDRVHLRKGPSADSDSMGLYFTGTEVTIKSGPDKEWVSVLIGSEQGYMMSDYLYSGNNPGSIQAMQPAAFVNSGKTGSWVNVRKNPSLQGDIAGRIYPGDTVTVLGETASSWYYINTGSLQGYVMADYLTVGSATSSPSSGKYKMLTYTKAPNSFSSVKIQYPSFDGSGLSALNTLIYNKVKGFTHEDLTDGLTIDYKAAVTLKNSKIASMIFYGSSYISGSIHPFTDLIALNVDLNTMKEITFADLYTAGDGFEEVFFEKAFFPTAPVTSYDAARFSEMLSMQSPEYEVISPFDIGSVTCFLKPEGIVLSMPAIHATGSDHFEAQLKYSDISPFYRLGQKYWEDD